MCQVAFRGGLDFRRADPYDPRWSRRLTIHLLSQLRANDLIQTESELQYVLGSLPVMALDTSRANQALERAFKLLQQQLKLLRPWDRIETQIGSIENMQQAWVTEYGDPSDPTVKAKIDACEAWLKQNTR